MGLGSGRCQPGVAARPDPAERPWAHSEYLPPSVRCSGWEQRKGVTLTSAATPLPAFPPLCLQRGGLAGTPAKPSYGLRTWFSGKVQPHEVGSGLSTAQNQNQNQKHAKPNQTPPPQSNMWAHNDVPSIFNCAISGANPLPATSTWKLSTPERSPVPVNGHPL